MHVTTCTKEKEKMKFSKFLSMAVLIVGMSTALRMPKANATSVTPTLLSNFQSGNATTECAQAGTYQNAFKIDEWSGSDKNGTHGNITISNSDGKFFDWSSNPNTIGVVIVKGGDKAYAFYYNPQAISDTHLYSPLNNGGQQPNVSHTTFCWNAPAPTSTPEPTPIPTDRPSISSVVSCGKVDITYNNPTRFFFSGDYRIDSEQGINDQYTNLVIQNGPHAGKTFGQRFNIVDLPAGQTIIKNILFAEDSGNHLVEYRIFRGAENDWYKDWESVNVESDCEENETPTPTPEPTQEPTPTPTPESTVKVYFSTVDPTCTSDQVSASAHIQKDGADQKDVRVVFKYNGEEKIAYTGNDGRTSVSFTYTGDGQVEVQPDGFPSDFHNISKETNCSTSGQVLGASTQGQVLGATTYAETGIVEDVMMSILGITGATLFATGSVLHVKNKA